LSIMATPGAETEAMKRLKKEVLLLLAEAGEQGIVVYRTDTGDTRDVRQPGGPAEGMVVIDLGRPNLYPAGRGFHDQAVILADLGLVQLRSVKRRDPGRSTEEISAILTVKGREVAVADDHEEASR
jgi:hypothetical protein